MALSVSGTVHQGKSTTIHVLVVDASSGSPVAGATVVLDGRKVGLKHLMKSKSDAHGRTTFNHVHPTRTGKILLSASKEGLQKATKQMKVRP
jgi:hypothetical protein